MDRMVAVWGILYSLAFELGNQTPSRAGPAISANGRADKASRVE